MEAKLLSLVSLGIDVEITVSRTQLVLKFFELSSGDFIKIWEGDSFYDAQEEIDAILEKYNIISI